MSVHGVALLAGLFVAPALLLWLGHGLRHQGRRGKGAFWGGVIGYVAATVLTLVVAMVPPVLWDAATRTLLVYWSLAAGAALGAVVGAAVGRPRSPAR